MRQAAETLARALGSGATIGFSGKTRPGDPAALTADITTARKRGFAPRVAFEAGVRRFARWFSALPA